MAFCIADLWLQARHHRRGNGILYFVILDRVTQFQTNGGRIWNCPACVKSRGISESDLLEGVEVAGAPRTMAFLASGGHLLA